MKKLIFIVFVFGLFAQLSAQVKLFEGTIEYTDKYSNQDTVFKLVYKIQKDKYKIDLEGDFRYIILNGERCRLYLPKDKSYYESTLKEQKSDKYEVDYWVKEQQKFKDGFTKETKTILGYLCQKITYFDPYDSKNPSNGGYRYEYWVIKDRTFKSKCKNPFNQFGLPYVDNCLYFGYIPLEYTLKMEYGGKEKDFVTLYQAIKIDENKLPKDCFSEPKGFTKIEEESEEDFYDYEDYEY